MEDGDTIAYGTREWWRWERRARQFLAWAEWVESPGYHRTPKGKRPRCGARCRDGHACQAPPVWDKARNAPRNGRCRLHGGFLMGPRRSGKREGSQPAENARREASEGKVPAEVWTTSEAEGVELLERVMERVHSPNHWVSLRAAKLVFDLAMGEV
jgi:hypothetical protein